MCALRIEDPVHIGLSDAVNPGRQSCYGFIFLVAVENPVSRGTFRFSGDRGVLGMSEFLQSAPAVKTGRFRMRISASLSRIGPTILDIPCAELD
jgi:hypothetical protein